MSLQDLQEMEEKWLMRTYARQPLEIVKGEGPYVWDSSGKQYLDFQTGISVTSLGHCHPAVVAAIRDQAGRLMHTSNLAYNEPALRLAERLAERSLNGKVFFTNSGTEANECAIKLVRKHAHDRGIATPEIVSLDGAFHGRTLGALAATPKLGENESFAPHLPGFLYVPRDDPGALRAAVGDSTAAVFIEPIQGESGIWPIADEVLLAARETCDAAGAVLVFDEIQTGMGRTGSLWAYEQSPVKPDVMTTAKALGGGLPIGACVTTPELGDVFGLGDHGSTFAGGPLVATAALSALEVTDDPDLLRRVRELGARLCEGLEQIDAITEVRGRGLMIGATLAGGQDAKAVQSHCLEQGLIVNVPTNQTLRLLPPLIVSEEEINKALTVLTEATASQ